MLGFFLGSFPSLVPDINLIPLVTISTALCLILSGVLFIFFWDRVPLVVWSVLGSTVRIIAMIVACVIHFNVAANGSRTVLLYVISGAFGLSESIAMGLASSYGTELFPSKTASFFGALRFSEGLSVAAVIAVGTWGSFMAVVGIVLALCVASVVCNGILYSILKRERLPPGQLPRTFTWRSLALPRPKV